VRAEPALDQLAQQRRTPALTLGGRLHEPEDALLPGRGHAQRDHDLIGRERLAIKQEDEPLRIIVAPRVQRQQRRRTRANDAARHGRLREPKHLGHGISRPLVLPTRQAA